MQNKPSCSWLRLLASVKPLQQPITLHGDDTEVHLRHGTSNPTIATSEAAELSLSPRGSGKNAIHASANDRTYAAKVPAT
jgi:hypothetical protein